MISIIVSSVRDEVFDAFAESVLRTVGVAFEIIRIENKEGALGICEAYNRGASGAVYPFLCFVHEDVVFLTPEWGRILLEFFESDSEIGLIGIAGSKTKTRMVSNWWQPVIGGHEPKRGKVLQHFVNKLPHITEWWEGDSQIDEVVTVDGVFMATRKSIWEQNKFDSELLTRFHAYDFDFSMQISQNWKICATRAILIEHFSLGTFDIDWVKETLAAHKKWRTCLPRSVHPDLDVQDFAFLEHQFINECYAKLARLRTGMTDSLRILYSAISLLYPVASMKGLYWRIKMTGSWMKGYFTRR